MTICPHCEQELRLAHNRAAPSVLRYGGRATTATLCCGNMVAHHRTQYTYIRPAPMPKDRHDDWGFKAEKPTEAIK
jgi:hypothetical protein